MKLSFEHGKLYIDNVKFSKYEVAPNGSKDLQPGSYEVEAEARYAHAYGKVLPYIDGIGWIGTSPDCAIVIGQVLGKHGVIPDQHLVNVLVHAIEAESDLGYKVLVEVA